MNLDAENITPQEADRMQPDIHRKNGSMKNTKTEMSLISQCENKIFKKKNSIKYLQII